MNMDVNQQKAPSLTHKMEETLNKGKKNYIQQLGKHKQYKIVLKKQNITTFPNTNKKVSLSRNVFIKNTDLFSLRFSQDDKLIAVGCADGSIKIINSENGLLTTALQGSFHTHNAPITSVRWKPRKTEADPLQLLSVSSDGTISHWDVLNQKSLYRTIENKGHNILSLDYSVDGQRYATAGKDYHQFKFKIKYK